MIVLKISKLRRQTLAGIGGTRAADDVTIRDVSLLLLDLSCIISFRSVHICLPVVLIAWCGLISMK